MGFEQYHEPAQELSQAGRTFASLFQDGDLVQHGEAAEEEAGA